jgi:hypothetical protein
MYVLRKEVNMADNEKEKEKDEKAPERQVDPMRALAKRAVEIAEAAGASLGSAVTATQADMITNKIGSAEPGKRFAPATLAQLQGYAQGGRGAGRTDIPAEGVEKLRTFCRELGSRRIWPRKVAAVVLALEEQRTGRRRPGTTPDTKVDTSKAVKEAEAEEKAESS